METYLEVIIVRQYTKKEIEEFQKKDKRISMQGLVQALITAGTFTKEEVIEMQLPLALSRKYSEAIFQLVESGSIEESNKTEPMLKPAEAKVKEAVEKKLGRGITVEDLDSWVNSLGKPELKSTLPQNMNSVDLIVKFLGGNNG